MKTMRKCDNHHCLEGKELEWVDDGSEEGTYVLTGEDCYFCEGAGEVLDVCYCCARNESECACDYEWNK